MKLVRWIVITMAVAKGVLVVGGCVPAAPTPSIAFDAVNTVVSATVSPPPAARTATFTPIVAATPTARVYYIEGNDAPLPAKLLPPTPWYLGTPTEFWQSPTPMPVTATPTAPISPLTNLTGNLLISQAMITPTPYAGSAFRAEHIRVVEKIPLTTDGESYDGNWGLAWHPDGNKLVFARLTGEFVMFDNGFSPRTALWIVSMADQSFQQLTTSGHSPKWSSDGTRIAYGTLVEPKHSEVWILDLNSRQQERIADYARIIDWVSDHTVAYVKDKHVYLYDLRTAVHSQAISLETTKLDGPYAFAISPRRDRLAVVDFRHLWMMNLDGTNAVIVTRWFDNSRGCLVWSPDGKKLIYRADKTLWVVDDSENKSTEIYRERGGVGDFSWSPDGNVIMFFRREGISVINSDGTGLQTLVPFSENEPRSRSPVWSPKGTMVAVERGYDLVIFALSLSD